MKITPIRHAQGNFRKQTEENTWQGGSSECNFLFWCCNYRASKKSRRNYNVITVTVKLILNYGNSGNAILETSGTERRSSYRQHLVNPQLALTNEMRTEGTSWLWMFPARSLTRYRQMRPTKSILCNLFIMSYLMSYVVHLILGRVMLTCDSFAVAMPTQ